MTTPQHPLSRISPLYLAGYVTLAGVGISGVLGIGSIIERWAALGLLIAFGLVLSGYRSSVEGLNSRRTQTLLALHTALVVLLLNLGREAYTFAILFYILSVVAMLENTFRVAALWVLLFILITGGYYVSVLGWAAGLSLLLPFAGGYFFFGVFANALNQANQARRQSELLLSELRQANQRLADYASQVEVLAAAEERNRLAREVHDTIGHRLTVASVQLEGARRLMDSDPGRVAGMIETVHEQVRQALMELRRTVAALRQPLETSLPVGQSMLRLIAAFQQATGILVQADLPKNFPVLPPQAEVALLRTIQEALTNIQRHSGASQAWLSLTCQADQVRLAITDNGRGYPSLDLAQAGGAGGFGLLGLRERAAQLQGELRLENLPQGGARLLLSLPGCLAFKEEGLAKPDPNPAG
jgi:signal transduction histidine kinase